MTGVGDELVGRAAERADLDGLLRQAESGVAGARLLTGPAGIGKTALAQYAMAAASGFRVVQIVGVESEMALGYAAVHHLVLRLREHVDRVPEPHRGVLDALLGEVPHGPLDPFLVGRAILGLVTEAARTQPVLAVIDDAQWLDDESTTALTFLGRRLSSERVASIVTRRDSSGSQAGFEGIDRVELRGLGATEARALLAAQVGGPVDGVVAEHLVSRTDGNPLALVELPSVLTAEQLRGTAPLPDPLPIGDRLSHLFTTRARLLSQDSQTVLLLASAERMGDPTLLRRAAATFDGLSWDDAVAAAEASGLVALTPKVQFRHPLVRSALYYSTSPDERRRAHAALAHVLDSEADVDRRAWHRGAAAAGPDEDVARALEASADRARQRGGDSAAAIFLRRAAELTPDSELASERFLEAARAELIGGQGPTAREILNQAKTAGLAMRQRADAAWTEALIHIVAGRIREAAALLADALPAIGADQHELAIGASVAATSCLFAGGHLLDVPTRQAIAVDVRAVVARCAVPDPIATLANGAAAMALDDQGAAIEMLRAGVTAAAADPALLQSLAGRHVHVVHFDAILAAAGVLDDTAWAVLTDSWMRLGRDLGALTSLPLALGLRSWLDVLQGRVGSAASHLAEIDDVVSLTGSRGLLGSPAPAQILRDAWLGNEDGAADGARRSMQDSHERGQGVAIDQAYAALLVLDLGAGRYETALRAARHLADHAGSVLGASSLADVVEAASRGGDVELARRALARLQVLANGSASPWSRGLLACAQGLVADGDDADEQFRLARGELSRTTIATDIARAQLLHGEWLRRARRRKEAREPLHEALAFFESMGAAAFAARARGELAATGEHVRSRTAPIDVLTPQEAQIARLAASGERNNDIAAQLYISTSTVEYHLRKVFMKLGVTSRTQLAQIDLPS